MELKNNKIIKKFIANNEDIIQYVNSLHIKPTIKNNHIKEISNSLKGNSYMFDISNTDITNKVTTYQSSNNIFSKNLPQIFIAIMDKIADTLSIPKDNVFLQILDMDKGGKILPHYDATVDGYINFKCNISVLSEDYRIYLDDNYLEIEQGDLYCFESSLYKHYTLEFNQRRILLSYGYLVKYEDLGRSEDDVRVRLSKRIQKYFQK